MTERTPTACIFRFEGGRYCLADETHPVHHDAWDQSRHPEPNHPFLPGSTVVEQTYVQKLEASLRARLAAEVRAAFPKDPRSTRILVDRAAVLQVIEGDQK